MENKNISIRSIIIILFVVIMLTTVGIVGYIVFSSWMFFRDDTIIVLILTIFNFILSIAIYSKFKNKFLKPIDHLIETTEKFSKGDLNQRANIVRNDEIGRIAKAFNKMADTISMLVNGLEDKVKERTIELEKTNNKLKESKDHLRLILDSTVEAIYGIDVDGNCTFCNASGIKILGYNNQNELIGRSMHNQVHHSFRDGKPRSMDECKIYNVLITGQGTCSDVEVFWRKDGTNLDVEYCAYPQYKNGKIVGAVITFTDITELNKNKEHIKYLTRHDSLTGLYNRMFFEDELKKVDTKENLPISIIYGDVNGLKMTNDIFGHEIGDKLLKKSAEIMKKVCRETDIIARIGGDEFTILLPNTEQSDTEKIIKRIKCEFANENIIAIKASISLGCDTKISTEQDIESIIKNAEGKMYKQKTLNRKKINSNIIQTIIETLHNKNPEEKRHSINVSETCKKIGMAMNLSDAKVRKLKEAGFLHDIGKIVLQENLLCNKGSMTEEQQQKLQQHSIIGYRILNLFHDTMDLAEVVLNHHENWDGSGYPKGLKGEEIPKLSRIIKIAESYDTMINGKYKEAMSKEESLKEIKRQSGIIFDPQIVDVFIDLMKEFD